LTKKSLKIWNDAAPAEPKTTAVETHSPINHDMKRTNMNGHKNSTILAKIDHFLTLYIRTTMRHNSNDNRLGEGTKMMKTERAKMNATEKKGSLSFKLCLPNLLPASPHPFRH
jgi:hypothetical protein